MATAVVISILTRKDKETAEKEIMSALAEAGYEKDVTNFVADPLEE